MGRTRTLKDCVLAVAGSYKDYPPNKVGGWISQAGGRTTNKVDANTTHLVTSEKAWKRKDAFVLKALELNDKGEANIKIVSFDWLDDSLVNKSKKREGPYLWKKLDKAINAAAPAKKKKDFSAEKDDEASKQKIKGVNGHVSMMAEVFQESTEKFVDEREKKKIERQIEEERRVRKQMEEEEKREKEAEENRKRAEIFGNGAKKASREMFTENHHVYMDPTGFKYDVILTKFDTRNNRNERYVLTLKIYESNATPATYATSCSFAGTAKRPSNTIIAALGCNFPTAFHGFKCIFREKTGVEWDDRIDHALARVKKERLQREQGPGAGRGTEDFERAVFEYHPPKFGSKGALPKHKVPPGHVIDLDGEDEGDGGAEQGANGSAQQTNGEDPGHQPAKGDSSVTTANEERTAPDNPADRVDSSIYDRDINEIMDGTYPFEPDFDSFDFGFDTTETKQSNVPEETPSFPISDAEATKQTSFHFPSPVPDSFEQGTQEVGETQVVEKAGGEFLEYLNHAEDEASAHARPDLGSFLGGGKRRASPVVEIETPTKKVKTADWEVEVGQ